MSLSTKPVVGRRRFVMVPYISDAAGHLAPVRPRYCPESGQYEDACKLHAERWRRRLFGPGFKLLVLYCVTHGRSFTIYPVGWPPYARSPLIAVDHRGRLVAPEDGGNSWQDTAFNAVVDASNEILWPEEVMLGPLTSAAADTPSLPCRRTQIRHVAGAIRLFAIDTAATMRERELVSRALGIDLMPLESSSQRIRDGPGLRARGKEGAKVLEQLPAITGTISGLLALGASRGYWGPTLSSPSR